MDFTAAGRQSEREVRRSVDTQPQDVWKPLILRLLPIPSVSRLLDELAAAWLESTHARAVCLFLQTERPPAMQASWAIAGQAPCRVEGRPPIAQLFDHDPVRAALREALPQSLRADLSRFTSELISFQNEGKALGGVLLLQEERGLGHPSEVAFLAELSSRMLAQYVRQQQAAAAGRLSTDLQAAKLEAMAELAAGAGHEINNPLAAISGRIQLLLRSESDPDRKQALCSIGGQAERIRDMIGDLMLFARPPEPVCELLYLDKVVETVVDRLLPRAREINAALDYRAAEPAPIWADPTQVAVAVSSLVENSLEAAGPGGRSVLTATPVSAGQRAMALLVVTDNGPGLSASDREHLFDPFYSGRQAGRGLGFGLSKCWRIVSNHRGRIEVESVPGVETTFRVFWPASAADPTERSA